MNALDVTRGRNIETSAAFRGRRERLLSAQGEATIEAVLADILDVTGVEDARVYENVTDVVDAAGRPAHSYDVVILGDDPDTDLDDLVGAAFFATKAGGMNTHRVGGAEGRTISVTDSQGVVHSINFSRAKIIEMDVVIDVDVIAADYAGDAAVKLAIVEQGDDYTVGEDVVAEANKAAGFGVSGVYDITAYTIEGGAGNVVIGLREIAEFDTSRVTVTSTPVVPG